MSAGTMGRLQRSEGATLVEFSLVAFIFVIVLLGVVEMGRMVLVFTALSDAAHAGVRYAIVHGDDTGVKATCAPSSCSGIAGAVNSYAAAGLIDTSNLTTSVDFPDSATLPGSRVTVTVSYTYDPIVSYFSSRLNVNMGSKSQGVIVF